MGDYENRVSDYCLCKYPRLLQLLVTLHVYVDLIQY